MSGKLEIFSPAVDHTWDGIQTFNSDLEMGGGIKIGSLLTKIFEHFFSGNAIDALWTLTDTAGVGSAVQQDGINGGVRLTSGATLNNNSSINQNGKRNFDPADCTIYLLFIYEAALLQSVSFGLASTLSGLAGTSHNVGVSIIRNTADFISIRTGDGTTNSDTSSDVSANTTDPIPAKIISNGTNARLFLIENGVWTLKVTKTTNLPISACQPVMTSFTDEAVAHFIEALYMKVLNDS